MEQYIPKSALVEYIKQRYIEHQAGNRPIGCLDRMDEDKVILSFINTLEAKGVEMENSGWIDCRKQMPPETHYTSDTLSGRKGWTKSDLVLAWDSMYGCRVDVTKNGKWMSEQGSGYTGQVVHGIIAWRSIPKFDEKLFN